MPAGSEIVLPKRADRKSQMRGQNDAIDNVFRGISMKRFGLSILPALLLATGVNEASATLLTYDDLPGAYPSSPLGFIEQGFNFSAHTVVLDISSASPFSHSGPAVSGDNAAFTDWGGSIIITKDGGGTFSFTDTYVKGWLNTPVTGSIIGYKSGTQVGVVSFYTSGWIDVFANSGTGSFSDIDQLVISAGSIGNGFLLLDNTTLTGVGAVPEPSTWAMILLGFAGLGIASYRRKSKPALMAA
jgi:hypothetical protein